MSKVIMTRSHKFANDEPHLPIIFLKKGQVVNQEDVPKTTWKLLKESDSWADGPKVGRPPKEEEKEKVNVEKVSMFKKAKK